MKKVIKFFSRTPTAVSTKSHSAVPTTREYANTPNASVAQNSSDIPGLAELAAKVEALTSIVEKIAVNQGMGATMPNPDKELQAVAQNSATIDGVQQIPEEVSNLAPEADLAVNQPLSAAKDDASTATNAVAQASEEADSGNDDSMPEGVPEGNLGAEVPANNGTYTDVPEDDIIRQFSNKGSIPVVSEGNLGLMGKESFDCLFK